MTYFEYKTDSQSGCSDLGQFYFQDFHMSKCDGFLSGFVFFCHFIEKEIKSKKFQVQSFHVIVGNMASRKTPTSESVTQGLTVAKVDQRSSLNSL